MILENMFRYTMGSASKISEIDEQLGEQEPDRLSSLLFNRKRYNVLAYILANQDEQLTIKEIMEAVDVSRPHVTDLINSFRDLGLVRKEKKGNMYLITVNEDSPYLEPLEELLRIDAEPLRLAAIDFIDRAMQDGGQAIVAAYLFGSVARGTPRIDSDIDILFIHEDMSEDARQRITDQAQQYGDAHGVSLSVTWYRRDEWERDRDSGVAFVERIQEEAEHIAGDDLR